MLSVSNDLISLFSSFSVTWLVCCGNGNLLKSGGITKGDFFSTKNSSILFFFCELKPSLTVPHEFKALNSCGTVREGFSSQKKNSIDEFLVEKKSPLVMPPDFNKLPLPQQTNQVTENEENKDIKSLLTDNKDTDLDNPVSYTHLRAHET